MDPSPSTNTELAELIKSAQTLAPEAEIEPTETVELVLMRIGKMWFGLLASDVQEIVLHTATTRVPALPAHVLGVSLVHGRLVPIIDLMRVLGKKVQRAPSWTAPRLVIATHHGHEIALVADETRGVIALPIPAAGSRDAGDDFVDLHLDWNSDVVALLSIQALMAAAVGGDS